eukprot:TRINITY_DN61482_c0_g1_i1.p1 TRINITY_DN61482_c0_g1~~TRINITY_DN61482_c0_g1_i1.p1  ORF type:complete len:194 (-),score=23.21 TRINITY_DN61482_c0_g1_i1:199-780(-)
MPSQSFSLGVSVLLDEMEADMDLASTRSLSNPGSPHLHGERAGGAKSGKSCVDLEESFASIHVGSLWRDVQSCAIGVGDVGGSSRTSENLRRHARASAVTLNGAMPTRETRRQSCNTLSSEMALDNPLRLPLVNGDGLTTDNLIVEGFALLARQPGTPIAASSPRGSDSGSKDEFGSTCDDSLSGILDSSIYR